MDTGPIVAYWVASDELHDRAQRLWKRAFEGGARFATTAMVLTEATHLVARRGSADAACRLLKAVLTSPRWTVFPVENELMLRAADRVGEPLGGTPLSWTDAVSFEVVRLTGGEPVFTFDRRHFDAGGFRIYGDADNPG
ncbi:MAG TPA: PIN domain-containing protein [Planctomycetota bacterium]|nr:PIN domain-containing protein [Planctomycetota bacterium]